MGEYTVVLTATNSLGSQTRSEPVSVQDVPINGLSVNHDGPTPLGRATTFAAAVAAGTNVIYYWDLGDGQTAEGQYLIHTYVSPGIYDVTVTAINGTTASEISTAVTVLDPGTDPRFLIFTPVLFRSSTH
jgi:PKD repeat protein